MSGNSTCISSVRSPADRTARKRGKKEWDRSRHRRLPRRVTRFSRALRHRYHPNTKGNHYGHLAHYRLLFWVVSGSGGEAVDFGLVGDVEGIDRALLDALDVGGYLPVVACLGEIRRLGRK